ncbi:hypothetical protein ACFVMC_11410 [Nocardia sp. NPDC127579]|uniref:hypothetical protein n=1 Tax=Nocardia sp. NPDC127579 TaxID=3345402 RepID=UPI0036430047
MGQFVGVMAVLILVGVCALLWQLTPQGARGQRTPIGILLLLALSFLCLTPPAEALFSAVRVNLGYLVGHLAGLSAITLTTLYWAHTISDDPRDRRGTPMLYGAIGVLLIALFLTSPQQQGGVGFAREFADSPRIQLYWMIQALLMMHTLGTLGTAVLRARRREQHWRRALLGVLLGVVVLYALYEAWVIVVVTVWPTIPPLWARVLTATVQVGASLLLVAGSIGPAVLGAVRGTRLARAYIDELTPVHAWLTLRYPQVRFRDRMSRRRETRVTDMLIEISDALRLLQREAPALAAAHGLDDAVIRARARLSTHCAAYELAAARSFSML